MSGGLPWLLLAAALVLLPSPGAIADRSRRGAWGRGRSDRPPRGADASLPLTLDLVAAALRGGKPVPDALLLGIGPAGAGGGAQGGAGSGSDSRGRRGAGSGTESGTDSRGGRGGRGADDTLGRVAGLLRLGAEPAEAWRPAAADPRLATLAQVARRSSSSGIRLAGALEQLAAELRAELRATAAARAQRAGVFAMAPLGLCFLPAFLCLGVIPVIVGIAAGMRP